MEKVEKKEIAKDTQKRKGKDIVRIVICVGGILFILFVLIMTAIRKYAG
jgi:hypothetical protein